METIQYNLFDAPEVKKIKKQKRPSFIEKREKDEKREIEKKLKKEKEFEDYWASVGKPQLYFFNDNGDVI